MAAIPAGSGPLGTRRFNGGVISYLVDSAITFAGGSVLGEHVVTAEYKVNYLKPARGRGGGDTFRAGATTRD